MLLGWLRKGSWGAPNTDVPTGHGSCTMRNSQSILKKFLHYIWGNCASPLAFDCLSSALCDSATPSAPIHLSSGSKSFLFLSLPLFSHLYFYHLFYYLLNPLSRPSQRHHSFRKASEAQPRSLRRCHCAVRLKVVSQWPDDP